MDDVVMKRAKTTLMRDALSVYLDVRALQRDHGHGRAPDVPGADAAYCVVRERERERKRRDVSVCREKQISETRSRVYKSTCVFDHDDARFVSSGTKRTTPTTTKRVVQKILETTREKTLENNGGRSIDRFYALLVIFTISFALTTTQKGPPTPKALSNI